MTKELLPPDPSEAATYYLTRKHGANEPWAWMPSERLWYSDSTNGSTVLYPITMIVLGYRLASVHPIPGPEQLDALYALPDRMEHDAWGGTVREFGSPAIRAAERCASMLRTTLEDKP